MGKEKSHRQWFSHRLPEIFVEPLSFRPGRFDPVHGEPLPPFAYVPFGGGARLCLGMTATNAFPCSCTSPANCSQTAPAPLAFRPF